MCEAPAQEIKEAAETIKSLKELCGEARLALDPYTTGDLRDRLRRAGEEEVAR
jgi:hypothetical protein